jgi:hypothetical protein
LLVLLVGFREPYAVTAGPLLIESLDGAFLVLADTVLPHISDTQPTQMHLICTGQICLHKTTEALKNKLAMFFLYKTKKQDQF